jgi:hypothetical protein
MTPPGMHFHLSLIKSLMRIMGFVYLLRSIPGGVTMLVFAEVVGIIEELYA